VLHCHNACKVQWGWLRPPIFFFLFFFPFFIVKSWDSSVNIATSYRLDDWMIGVWFLAGAGNFCPWHCIQTGSGAHPTSYPVGIGSSFPGCKAARLRSWSLTFIKCWCQRMCGGILPLPKYVFMAWCLVKHKKNFTFTFIIPYCCLSEWLWNPLMGAVWG
jgi:hypothetical protein